MIAVSLSMVQPHNPCGPGWEGYLTAAGKSEVDDVLVPLSEVVQATDLGSAMYCLRALPDHQLLWRSFFETCCSRLEGCTGTRSKKYADKARACSKQENWAEAACLVPALASKAVGWRAFELGGDYKLAEALETAAQSNIFIQLVS